MQFGVCATMDKASLLKQTGFDFIELPVQRTFRPESPDEAVEETLRQAEALPLPARAGNSFLPAELKVVGPQVDAERLARYVEAACRRAARAGVQFIVFGSGRARWIPDGFDRAKAERQLVEFGRMAGPIAQRHGIVIVAEPLRREESNTLNTVGEAADLAREVGHANFALLVDAYHWAWEKDSSEAIVANGALLRHAHLSVYGPRAAPGAVPCDFSEFFRALKAAGYAGGLSLECRWQDLEAEAPGALAELRRFAEAASL